MRFLPRRGSALLCAILFLVSGATSARAAIQHVVSGQQAMTIGLPGGLAGLVKPDGAVYTADPYGLGPAFSILVVLDTGSSGCLLSETDGGPNGLNIAVIPDETYQDVGIGGTETFNVSQSTGLLLASIGIMPTSPDYEGEDPSENLANYSSYGSYNFQIRQSDPIYGGLISLGVNIIGTPVLNQHVMHVTPNHSGYTTLAPAIDYLVTDLLPAMPSDLPTTGVFRVGLTYENFVTEPTSVSTSTNPLIENVRLARGDQEVTRNWLFDTGASLTIIGQDMAIELGIDLVNDIVTTTTITGVGNTERTLFGYNVDRLTVPLSNGEELVFPDVMVFVPEEGALPADLTGIFGMNLLNQSFPDVDNIFSIADSPFSDWYVDPFNHELVLVLDGSVVPEPSTIALLAIAAMAICGRGIFRRK